MHDNAPQDGEFWTDERCFIRELINEATQPGASLARCRVTPGTLTQKHSLSVNEWYVILSGSGTVHIGAAQAAHVASGETVFIPAGVSQQIRNTGSCDLIFHCLCMPRFETDCYRNLEA